jgi:hypothetical protein
MTLHALEAHHATAGGRQSRDVETHDRTASA